MNPNDRLIIRSSLLDEVQATKMQLEHQVSQMRKEIESLKTEISELKKRKRK